MKITRQHFITTNAAAAIAYGLTEMACTGGMAALCLLSSGLLLPVHVFSCSSFRYWRIPNDPDLHI